MIDLGEYPPVQNIWEEARKLRAEIERLTKRCKAFELAVDMGRVEIERLQAAVITASLGRERLEAENERLKAALDQRHINDQCILDEAIKAATKSLRTSLRAADMVNDKLRAEVERLRAEKR